jgi:hypothetical protein
MKPTKKRSQVRGGDDPARGLKRDSRRDGRRRFGVEVTLTFKLRATWSTGKPFSYTRWYHTAKQREQAIESETRNCRKLHTDDGRGFEEVKTFKLLER